MHSCGLWRVLAVASRPRGAICAVIAHRTAIVSWMAPLGVGIVRQCWYAPIHARTCTPSCVTAHSPVWCGTGATPWRTGEGHCRSASSERSPRCSVVRACGVVPCAANQRLSLPSCSSCCSYPWGWGGVGNLAHVLAPLLWRPHARRDALPSQGMISRPHACSGSNSLKGSQNSSARRHGGGSSSLCVSKWPVYRYGPPGGAGPLHRDRPCRPMGKLSMVQPAGIESAGRKAILLACQLM